MTHCVALIPARLGSTRLPGKPLLKETGKHLIQHVHDRVCAATKVDRVIVATDDPKIIDAVHAFGGEAVLTDRNHPSGSDRIAEAARALDAGFILNVQGDEPEIDPRLLDRLVSFLEDQEDADLATPAVGITEESVFRSPHVVKVVTGGDHRALYFSRRPIPHGAVPGGDPPPLKHIGVYAYRRAALLRFTGLDPAPLERVEKLEQLRALHHGMVIKVLVTHMDHHGIDTREEYEAFVQRCRGRVT